MVVGLYEGSKSWPKAQEAGLKVATAADAAKQADVIMILVNDELAPKIYEESIAPNLSEGKYLMFAHGFNIHFGQIKPPSNVNVLMIAPKGPGHTVRSQYQEGKGVPCLIAVHQDPSGDTQDVGLAYALVSAVHARAYCRQRLEKKPRQIFSVSRLCCAAAVCELMKAGFDTLVDAGYEPESAYFECLHEMKLIVDLVNEGGLVIHALFYQRTRLNLATIQLDAASSRMRRVMR